MNRENGFKYLLQKQLSDWAKQAPNGQNPEKSYPLVNKQHTAQITEKKEVRKMLGGQPGGHEQEISPELSEVISNWPQLSELTKNLILNLSRNKSTQSEGNDSNDNQDISE